MWGGRFAVKPDALMQAINVSIGFDRRPSHLRDTQALLVVFTSSGALGRT